MNFRLNSENFESLFYIFQVKSISVSCLQKSLKCLLTCCTNSHNVLATGDIYSQFDHLNKSLSKFYISYGSHLQIHNIVA